MSRANRVRTGVDRVELAYLDHFLGLPGAFGLIRTGLGFLLLDRYGLPEFRRRLEADDWGPMDRISRWSRRLDAAQKAAVSTARSLAVARCLPGRLPAMLRGRGVTDYYNVGHAGLDGRTLAALGRAGLRRHVLIHDTIPLDHPDWQRPGTALRFRRKLDAALTGADRIICNSEATAADLKRHANGPVPPLVVAPLGVGLPAPSAGPNPVFGTEVPPYFVTVGTIEPRKNHALLLDVWDRLGPAAPVLVVCGPRGWRNEKVFQRLDRAGPRIVERADLGDADLAAVIRDARALLFPSRAEGYGLPPMEAAALGAPVVCGDLAIYRETLGDIPVYLNPADPYLWINEIERLTEQVPDPKPWLPPCWPAHFKTVLSMPC